MKIPNEQPSGRTTIIYCDGACIGNPGPGGWAALIKTMDGEVEVGRTELWGEEPARTTNMRQEMLGAIHALGAIPEGTCATLHSDSQVLIKGMTEWLPGWIARGWRNAKKEPVANKDLWQELVALAAARVIVWTWVKGHAGQPDNERVDQLASTAAIAAQKAIHV